MILASASPRRRELLRACGLEVTIIPADIDEARLEGESATELVERLATAKARAIARELVPDGKELLVAADTIVWDELGDVLGKPHDEEDARRMLKILSGRTHYVSTGVCVAAFDEGEGWRHASFVETTDVTFFELTDAQVAAYVASGEPMDKAGAYGIQGLGRSLVRGIVGDYPNVVGLPVGRVLRELDRLAGTDLVTKALGGSHA
ncbi:MAG: septum formation protein Maf [Atopobiaceae bacterium]|nr:septum formation protein Maf [Atopobiaceae bacterium]